MCTFIPNMMFPSLILWLGGLCTDTIANDADTDDDNYAQRENHDYIGSFGIISKEPKITPSLTLDFIFIHTINAVCVISYHNNNKV